MGEGGGQEFWYSASKKIKNHFLDQTAQICLQTSLHLCYREFHINGSKNLKDPSMKFYHSHNYSTDFHILPNRLSIFCFPLQLVSLPVKLEYQSNLTLPRCEVSQPTGKNSALTVLHERTVVYGNPLPRCYFTQTARTQTRFQATKFCH